MASPVVTMESASYTSLDLTLKGTSGVYTAPLSHSNTTTGWFSLLPASWVPYAQLMRLDRPAGLYAFYFPYLFGLAFAACLSTEPISPTTLFLHARLLLLWCIILRGASCTWNDNVDQEYDRAVERCRHRPIARGAVTTLQGDVFTVAQTVVGLAYVWHFFPVTCLWDTAWISILFIIYPFGKRFTNYPQLILGFPFSGGIIMACHAVGVDPWSNGANVSATGCLVGANVLWTMIYDTIYAHQDLQDDIKAGVKSMAVRFGDRTKTLAGVLAVGQVALLVRTGMDLELATVWYVIGCGGTAVALAAMIGLVDLRTPASCAWWFKMDFWFVGGSMTAGYLGHYLLKYPQQLW